MDYTTTCSPWMVGVKTLIAESLVYSEDKAKESELPDHNNHDIEVKVNAALENNREKIPCSVSSPTSEK